MSRLVALLAFLIAIPAAGATTPDVAVNAPITVDDAKKLVVESEVEAAFRGYGPTGDGEVRMLVLIDRPGDRPDLALAADGSLWMVSRGKATPATSRDLSAAHINKLRLLVQLQARKIRPIALRIPQSWLVTGR